MLMLVLIHVHSIQYKYVSFPLTHDTLLFTLTNGWPELVRLLIPNRMDDFYLSK